MRVIALVALLVGSRLATGAHDPGWSTGEIRSEHDRLHVQIVLAEADADRLVSEDRMVIPLRARAGDRWLAPADVSMVALNSERKLSFVFAIAGSSSAVLEFGPLAALPRGHRLQLTVRAPDGAVIARILAGATSPPFELPSLDEREAPSRPTSLSSRSKAMLAAEAFLIVLALLAAARDLRSLRAYSCLLLGLQLLAGLIAPSLGLLDASLLRPLLPLLAVCLASELLFGRDGAGLRFFWCGLLGLGAGALAAGEAGTESTSILLVLVIAELALIELVARLGCRFGQAGPRRALPRTPLFLAAFSSLLFIGSI